MSCHFCLVLFLDILRKPGFSHFQGMNVICLNEDQKLQQGNKLPAPRKFICLFGTWTPISEASAILGWVSSTFSSSAGATDKNSASIELEIPR